MLIEPRSDECIDQTSRDAKNSDPEPTFHAGNFTRHYRISIICNPRSGGGGDVALRVSDNSRSSRLQTESRDRFEGISNRTLSEYVANTTNLTKFLSMRIGIFSGSGELGYVLGSATLRVVCTDRFTCTTMITRRVKFYRLN